ncbi:hypothetical protein, partial [Peribacillus simplex]|uniref:hypothetical protein n=1 Tax=Peribacillus simplex TaxID=1478 RepID=UPI000BD48DFA
KAADKAADKAARGVTVFSSSFLVLAGYGFVDKKRQPIYSAVFFIPFTREFRAFTREFRNFTRELRFNYEFRTFTREFRTFTREFRAFIS